MIPFLQWILFQSVDFTKPLSWFDSVNYFPFGFTDNTLSTSLDVLPFSPPSPPPPPLFFFLAAPFSVRNFLDQRLNLCLLKWNWGVWTTSPPGRSLFIVHPPLPGFSKYGYLKTKTIWKCLPLKGFCFLHPSTCATSFISFLCFLPKNFLEYTYILFFFPR